MWAFNMAALIQAINMLVNAEPGPQLCWSGYYIITSESAQHSAMDNNTMRDSQVIFNTGQ